MSDQTPAGQTPSPPAEPPAAPPASAPEAPKAPDVKPPEKPAEPAKSVVPESYTFAAPEGVEFDVKQLDAFVPVFKEIGLTQEAAQKLASAYATQLSSQREAAVTQWTEEARNDKELGGAKFDENLAIAKSAIARFSTPEFVSYLEKTGLGSHPAMLKVFHKIGKAISEDAPPSPGTPPAQRTAKDIYSHPTSQAVLT